MNKDFKSKRLFALFFAVIVGLSVLYSLFLSPYENRVLTDKKVVLNQEPNLKSEQVKNGRNYWIEFGFVGEQKNYIITELKYLHYKRLKSELKLYDTIKISFDKDYQIFSLNYKGQDYLDIEKIQKSDRAYNKFSIFFRTIIFVALLPILFFRHRPKFWHSGFKFEFRFTYLFLMIVGVSVSIYFYLNGFDFIMSFNIKDLK